MWECSGLPAKVWSVDGDSAAKEQSKTIFFFHKDWHTTMSSPKDFLVKVYASSFIL